MALPAIAPRSDSPKAAAPKRLPRDAQRGRVYLAETPMPSSPLPGLDACARWADRVVGTLWWQARFPERDLASVPRLRPGNGARQAFYREEANGPTITLPRRYRTKGVVLHELVHWALGLDTGLPAHGRTFARVLLDATTEFCGAERGNELATSYRAQRVRVGKPARSGPDGHLHYGWDERLRLGRGRIVDVWHHTSCDTLVPADVGAFVTKGVFEGYDRGASVVRLTEADGIECRIVSETIFEVTFARDDCRA